MDSDNNLLTTIKKGLSELVESVGDLASLLVVWVSTVYEALDDLVGLCVRFGWCFTPDFPLWEIISSAVELRQARNPRHLLAQRIRNFLKADDWLELRQFLWSFRDSKTLGRKRAKILKDSIYALLLHGRDRFNAAHVIVPTLLSIIDGMISDFALEHLQIDNWHKQANKTRVRKAIESVCFSFDRPGIDLLFSIVYSTAYKDTLPISGRRFNRHHIVHGNWLEFGRIEYVVRLYLLVFFTTYILDEYSARKESGENDPVSERSRYSMLLSTNPVEGFKQLAKDRLVSKGLDSDDWRDI